MASLWNGFLLLHRYRLGGKHADKWPRTGSRSNYFTDTAGQLWLLGDFGTRTAAALSQQHRTRSGQRCKHPAVLIKNGFYVMLNKKCNKLVTQLLHTHINTVTGLEEDRLNCNNNYNQWSVIKVGELIVVVTCDTNFYFLIPQQSSGWVPEEPAIITFIHNALPADTIHHVNCFTGLRYTLFFQRVLSNILVALFPHCRLL